MKHFDSIKLSIVDKYKRVIGNAYKLIGEDKGYYDDSIELDDLFELVDSLNDKVEALSEENKNLEYQMANYYTPNRNDMEDELYEVGMSKNEF